MREILKINIVEDLTLDEVQMRIRSMQVEHGAPADLTMLAHSLYIIGRRRDDDKFSKMFEEMTRSVKTTSESVGRLCGWTEKKEDSLTTLANRVNTLMGYNINGDNAVEYCVGDAVDDYMQELGYVLEERENRLRLVNRYGGTIGELDGLLTYQHPTNTDKVAIMVEAKSHINPAEYGKVHKTVRVWKQCIQESQEPNRREWHKLYKTQCGRFRPLVDENYKLLTAVGSPTMSDKIAQEAAAAGFIVVSHATYAIFNRKPFAKDNFGLELCDDETYGPFQVVI